MPPLQTASAENFRQKHVSKNLSTQKNFSGLKFDIIGDVHGQADRLEALLRKMGYYRAGGTWQHTERTAIFVGDIIDRGRDNQLKTLRIVRQMCDAGNAKIVLGNHEFNAVAFATVDPSKLDYCRPHTSQNRKQHREFLEELTFNSPLHRSTIDWFQTIPLWIDLNSNLRVVHACWDTAAVDHLKVTLDDSNSLTEQAIIDGTTAGHQTFAAIETILKGPEVPLSGHWYFDKSGKKRFKARVAWWDRNARTIRDGTVIANNTQIYNAAGERVQNLPDIKLPMGNRPYTETVPVIFGHYWNSGKPQREGPATVCVDYSAGSGGPLAAYRWDGEQELVTEHIEVC